MVRKARIKKRGNNRLLFDISPGITVTAKRPSLVKLSNQAALSVARSKLLASQVRAMQKVITAQVLNSAAGGSDTSAAQFALQQQLTDARIAASNVALLQKQERDIAATLDAIERRSKQLQNEVNIKLKQLKRDYLLRYSKSRAALDRSRSEGERNALRTSLVRLSDLYASNKSNIINIGRQEKARLSQQFAENTTALLAKRMESEKALQADRQARALQQRLDRLQAPAVLPMKMVKEKVKKRKQG
jgi:hypothetical protein